MTFEAKVRIRHAIEHCGYGIPSEYQDVIFESIEKEFTIDEKRDYFAWQALIGIIASPLTKAGISNARYAEVAYGIADAMLAARDK